MSEIPSGSKSFIEINPHLFGVSPGRKSNSGDVDQEETLHDEIISFCKSQSPPWIYFHGSMAHKAYRTKGENDFHILADRGRVFFIECKAKRGKLSPDQRDIIHWAALLGHTIHIVASMDEFRRIVEC